MLRGGAPPLALGDLGAVGDAQQDVVRLPLRRVDELHIVGGDQGQLAIDRQVDQRRLDLVLHLEAVADQLDVQTTGEKFPKAIEQALGAAAVAARQRTPDRPLGAAGQRDQTVAIGREQIELEFRGGAGLAIQVGAAQQLHQVAIAGLVLHQNRQPGRQRGPTVAARLLVAGDRQQAADDRLHAGLCGALAELERGKQVGPVGDGHRGHALARDPRDQLGQTHGAVEQRIAGTHPEVDEGGVAQEAAPAGDGSAGYVSSRDGSTNSSCGAPPAIHLGSVHHRSASADHNPWGSFAVSMILYPKFVGNCTISAAAVGIFRFPGHRHHAGLVARVATRTRHSPTRHSRLRTQEARLLDDDGQCCVRVRHRGSVPVLALRQLGGIASLCGGAIALGSWDRGPDQ